jgi:hypothetical protein
MKMNTKKKSAEFSAAGRSLLWHLQRGTAVRIEAMNFEDLWRFRPKNCAFWTKIRLDELNRVQEAAGAIFLETMPAAAAFAHAPVLFSALAA